MYNGAGIDGGAERGAGLSWALVAAVAERLAEALETDGPPQVADLLAPALADAAALFVTTPSGLHCAQCAAGAGLDPVAVRAALSALAAGPAGAEAALDPQRHGGLAACQLLPLAARGAAVGALALGTAAAAARARADDELLGALCRALALGLDNIRRHAEARRALQERQVVQAALQERQALFDAIFENAGIGIALGALEWDMLLTNRAFCAIVGYSEQELRQRSVMAITHPDDLAVELELAQELADGKRPRYEMEKRYIHKDGHEVPVRITGLVVRDEAGRLRWGMALVEDLSERRRAEAARLDLERKMLEAQKLESLGMMAGGIAHDFNNILTAVLGHADLALHSPDLHPSLAPNLAAVAAGAQRAADLTAQILAYAGKGRVVLERVNVNQVLDEISGLLAVSATRHCAVERRLAPALPAVEGDPAQMRQLVLNLLLNAAEAVRPAGGLVQLESALVELGRAELDRLMFGGDLEPGLYVRLSVTDNGCGMDAATLGRIFDPFFTTKFLGRGLGLPAVQGIVRAHRGTLHVSSAPGQGTHFQIWLPAAGEPALPPARTAAPAPDAGSVLVIDDEPAVLAVASELLRRLGLRPYAAPDGPRGLGMIEDGLPDLLLALIDVTMPQMSGDSVARAVQRLRPGTPVVLMSGYSSAALGEHDGAGAYPFLQKPFTLESLQAALAAARPPSPAA